MLLTWARIAESTETCAGGSEVILKHLHCFFLVTIEAHFG